MHASLKDKLSGNGQIAIAKLLPVLSQEELEAECWPQQPYLVGDVLEQQGQYTLVSSQSVTLDSPASACAGTCFFCVLCAAFVLRLYFIYFFLLLENPINKFCHCAANLWCGAHFNLHRVQFVMPKINLWSHKVVCGATNRMPLLVCTESLRLWFKKETASPALSLAKTIMGTCPRERSPNSRSPEENASLQASVR